MQKTLFGNTLACMIIMLSIIPVVFAGKVSMISYRTDPAPLAHSDFTLYVTFSNDASYAVANVPVTMQCPQVFACENATISIPGDSVQEIAFPIVSRAPAGLQTVNISWDDQTFALDYQTTGEQAYIKQHVWSSIPINVKEQAVSSVELKTKDLLWDEENRFSVEINASSLHNAQFSLYSQCMAFNKSLFYYPLVDGAIDLSTSAFVTCRESNTQATIVIISDELSTSVPLGVHVIKNPHANITITPITTKLHRGKETYRVMVRANGTKAEKLSLTVVRNAAINSPDVIYLGDVTGDREAVFEIESDKTGTFPLDIEAKWMEDGESFMTTSSNATRIAENPYTIAFYILLVIAICAGVWFWIKR